MIYLEEGPRQATAGTAGSRANQSAAGGRGQSGPSGGVMVSKH